MKKIIAPLFIASLILAHIILRILFAESMLPAQASSDEGFRARMEQGEHPAIPVQAHLVLNKKKNGTKDAIGND